MVNPIDSQRIRREIANKYESDPSGWRLLWGYDGKGHNNLLVVKGSKLWWLKEEMINPLLTVGCGIRSPLEVDLESKVFGGKEPAPSYGLRPIHQDQMERIMKDLAAGITPQNPIREILRSEPKAITELDTSFLMQGPFYRVPQITDILSDKQRELDAKLNSELHRLILKRYPQLVMSYT
jgi:hypothetical protein